MNREKNFDSEVLIRNRTGSFAFRETQVRKGEADSESTVTAMRSKILPLKNRQRKFYFVQPMLQAVLKTEVEQIETKIINLKIKQNGKLF